MKPDMGLSGWLRNLANVGAVTLICLMFYQDRHQALEAAKEDRRMFRQELDRFHAGQEKHGEAIRQLTAAIKELADQQERAKKR